MRCLTKFHLRTIIIYVKHTFKAYGFSDRSIRWNCIDSLFIQVEKMRLQKRQKPSFTPNMYWHRGWSIELKSQAWNAISHLTKVTLLLFHPQTYWIFDENTSKKTVRRFPKLHRTNVDIFANVHTQRKQFEYTISSVNSIKLTSLHWRNAYVTLWIWLRISKWKPRENGLFRRANFLPATDSIFYHIIRCLLMMQLLNGTCRDLAMKNAFFTSV